MKKASIITTAITQNLKRTPARPFSSIAFWELQSFPNKNKSTYEHVFNNEKEINEIFNNMHIEDPSEIAKERKKIMLAQKETHPSKIDENTSHTRKTR